MIDTRKTSKWVTVPINYNNSNNYDNHNSKNNEDNHLHNTIDNKHNQYSSIDQLTTTQPIL